MLIQISETEFEENATIKKLHVEKKYIYTYNYEVRYYIERLKNELKERLANPVKKRFWNTWPNYEWNSMNDGIESKIKFYDDLHVDATYETTYKLNANHDEYKLVKDEYKTEYTLYAEYAGVFTNDFDNTENSINLISNRTYVNTFYSYEDMIEFIEKNYKDVAILDGGKDANG